MRTDIHELQARPHKAWGSDHKAQDLLLSIHQVPSYTSATNTPLAYHNKAQGRGAHPGYGIIKHAYPNGVSQ